MESAIGIPLQLKEDHFESFFVENYKRIYQLLYRLTGQKAEAEDLTVETFVRYLERPPAKSDHPAGWLYRVATRLGYNSLRAAKRRRHYEETALTFGENQAVDPIIEVERARSQLKVHQVLRQMPRRDAEMLLLHHSGFSYKEIAAALNVSPNSIGTLLTRAEKEFEKFYLELEGGSHAASF